MRFPELGLADPIAAQLHKRGIQDEEELREYLSKDQKGLHVKTRILLQRFLEAVEDARLNNTLLPSEYRREYRVSSRGGRPSKVTARVIQTFPEVVADTTTARLFQLEDAIIALFVEDQRVVDVLRYRLGLQKVLPQTLVSIGERLGVTRERVRQIEAKKLRSVKRLFTQGSVGSFRLHPDLLAFAKEFSNAVDQSADRSVLDVETFKSNLLEKAGVAPPLRKGVMRLFLEWNELMVHSERDQRVLVFRSIDVGPRKLFRKHLQTLERVLRQRVEPIDMSEFAELASFDNQDFEVSYEDILPLLDFEPEWLSEEVFQVPLHCLRGRASQAVRILHEWGEGLHYREMAERIREVEGESGPDENNLRNQMITDDRLRPVGRSGIWVLAEWDHIDTDSIKDVIAKVLTESDRPLSRDEILDAVQQRRPCSDTSVDIYLTSNPEFLLVAHDLYRYRPGADAGDSWNRETLGQWIEAYFVENPGTVRMKTLAAAFEARAGVEARRLAIVMGHHPALISTRDRAGRVLASLRPDWREYTRAPRVRDSLRARVDRLLQELLVEAPEWPLGDVVNLLSEELGSPPSSLYTYVRESTACCTFDVDGQKWVGRSDDWRPPEEL